MELDPNRVTENVRRAETIDLLDRVTVFRPDLDKSAYPLIMKELQSRGITPADILVHEEARINVLKNEDGIAFRCTYCSNPAISTGRGWFRILRLVPFFPRRLFWCSEHLPNSDQSTSQTEDEDPKTSDYDQ